MTAPRPADALPVLAVADELLDALDRRGAAVLVAPPGTGKTTGVPPLLVGRPWAGDGRIVVVEPRRLAARTAAARMAHLVGGSVGGAVGYSVRGERRTSAATRIEVVTEGLFLRRLQSDPTLEGVAAVLLDEFHERSVDIDLALAMLLDVRASLRPDLRLLVMSATIDPSPVSTLLGGDGPAPAPVVEATAPMFPVQTRYRPGSAHDPLEDRVADVVHEALRECTGDVLVFLPGRPEIRRAARALERRRIGGDGIEVAQLHGSLSPAEQEHVVRPPEDGRRRVILSTSLAETSITVPGVRVVIDAGRRRTIRVDPHTGLPALTTGPVSRAGADQRRGRAGRLAPGTAYRLWAEPDERHRPPAEVPEVVDGDLASLVLQLRAWGVEDPAELRWLDPPEPEAVARATSLLEALGAIDGESRQLTTRGREMATIGFHPRLAAVAAEGRASGRAATAAEVIAVLETSRSGALDLAERVRALRAGHAEGDTQHALSLWRRALGPGGDPGRDALPGPLDDDVARLLLAGYADRIARRREGTRTDERGRRRVVFHLRSGGEVALDEDEHLARCEWLVVADLDAGPPGQPGRVHLAATVPPMVATQAIAPLVADEESVAWDPRRGDAAAQRRRHLGAITVSSEPLAAPPPDAVRAALLEGLRSIGLGLLGRLDGADDLRRRVAWLRATRPDDDWPDWSDEALVEDAEQWLAPVLTRARSRADLNRVDVRAALLTQLDWRQQRSIDELAPTHWTTTSGRRVALRYGEVDGEPATVLAAAAVRDLLGTDVHPTIGAGRTPITLELLSPAGRPVQRTDDLPGFWRGSYAAVRADLRGRYPKHPWPERPWEH